MKPTNAESTLSGNIMNEGTFSTVIETPIRPPRQLVAKLIGLALFFPFGYWLLPWLLRKTRAKIRSRFIRIFLISSVCILIASFWSVFLLMLLFGYVLVQGFASGEFGQGMIEQSSVTDCLRMVRDKELSSTLGCSSETNSLLKMDDENYLKPMDIASRLCLLSIQSASYIKVNHPDSESLISDLSDQAKSDCSHPAVNVPSVESAFFTHLIDASLAYEILGSAKVRGNAAHEEND
jgi:hypothetical protein